MHVTTSRMHRSQTGGSSRLKAVVACCTVAVALLLGVLGQRSLAGSLAGSQHADTKVGLANSGGQQQPSARVSRMLLQAGEYVPKKYNMSEEVAAYVAAGGRLRSSFMPTPHYRWEFGTLMAALGPRFSVGVELGVQTGSFSEKLLNHWPTNKKYYMVDLWGKQVAYVDHANVDDDVQLRIMDEARRRVSGFGDKATLIKNLTVNAAGLVPGLVDFVYVDARHDYCGVMEDIMAWWPKLRPGGIMAGHDYNSAREVFPGQDWSLCGNGSRFHGAVMGAANDFAMINQLTLTHTFGVNEVINWVLRKPGLKGRNAIMHDHAHAADTAAPKTTGAVSVAQRRSLKDNANAPPAPTPDVYDLMHEIKKFAKMQPDGRHKSTFLITPNHKMMYGKLLEAMGGFEGGVGVHIGGANDPETTEAILGGWSSNGKYLLVDSWNESSLQAGKSRFERYAPRVQLVTGDVSAVIKEPVDFVYLNAHRDFCSVSQELEFWWGKLRPGGLIGGPDYRDAASVWPKQDWSLCPNGTHDHRAVIGAVNLFAMHHSLAVGVTWGEGEKPSWLLRKPSRREGMQAGTAGTAGVTAH